MHFEKIASNWHLEIISRDQNADSKFKCSNHPAEIERVKFLAKAGVIPNNVSTKTNFLEQVGKVMQKSVDTAFHVNKLTNLFPFYIRNHYVSSLDALKYLIFY